ncbi:MAG: 30S ribosomal protein S19 [Candidatus Thalassarchaeaceae archaeon]|jgi:small subunit ribosomal protein S19|nr:30S ribosomal protein S19 [Candidatus Thalassarchaeaceae archaeon]MDP6703026.1 30S ribosomal protein S19 [Candidatus Thalassarchaeaceae archaeon]MDP7004140.1 30S ribosomal protein S19 [Candidatus Thalassarchaeaceae archaeon]
MARKRRVFRTAKMARRQARKRRSKISERRKKEFRWRGYSLGELQEMPLYPPDDDIDAPCIATLMPSRVKRTLARGLSLECEKLLERVRESNGKVVKTHCRGMYVLPEMVGSTIGVHDGQNFVKVEIVPNMIGHALGEFAKTRKSVTHTGPGVGATRSSQHVALK